jgi:hypothetical protein
MEFVGWTLPPDADRDRPPIGLMSELINIDEQWRLLVSWLPAEGEASEVDAKTLVAEQWEKAKAALRALGMTPPDVDE